MGQIGKPISVEIAAAGTPQRVVTDSGSKYRWVPYCYFEAFNENAGLIFVGDANVADDNYIAMLNGASVDRSFGWNAYQYPVSPGLQEVNRNMLDLYNVWVDSSENGDIVFVTVPDAV